MGLLAYLKLILFRATRMSSLLQSSVSGVTGGQRDICACHNTFDKHYDITTFGCPKNR